MNKIRATVNFSKGQASQSWDLAGYTGAKDDDPVLVLFAIESGDLVGIPLAASRIKRNPVSGLTDYKYTSPLSIDDAELIPKAGISNQGN